MCAGGATPTIDQITEAVRTQGGSINKEDYSKFIGKLQEFGFTTKTEIPHKDKDIRVSCLVEKLNAFQQNNNGTAQQMLRALRAAGIKQRDLSLF